MHFIIGSGKRIERGSTPLDPECTLFDEFHISGSGLNCPFGCFLPCCHMNEALTHSQTWSTIGTSEPFSYWREVVCQAFTKLTPERATKTPFSGEIKLTDINELGSIAEISAAPQIVERRKSDVADNPSDSVFINFQISGTSSVRQRGIESKLQPGDFVMLDARQPFEMHFGTYFKQACLHLPIATLDEHGLNPATSIARTIKSNQMHGAALSDCISSLLSGDSVTGDYGHIAHLLSLCYKGDQPQALADQHLKHIQHYVANNCSEPNLTPTAVAGHFRISVRYLHKLFARSGTSYGRFLLKRRLHLSRLDVILEPDRPLFDIAIASGFNSASHFSRAFVTEFGMTPTRMRGIL